MTRPQGQIPISVYIFLSEYHYLGTRKPNKRIYTAIENWGVFRLSEVRKLRPSGSWRYDLRSFCQMERLDGSLL